MKKIAVVTSTRAEFGLLLPVIKKLRKYENDYINVDLIVTGTHLSESYGFTVKEIEESGVRIDKRIPIDIKTDRAVDISRNQADTLVKFSCLFEKEKYDAVVILGDRYEMLAIAIAAGNLHTAIFHLCGGDTTEGAIDEWIRHSITKMSYMHFVTNNDSYRRVIQLGESPDRVFNYGSTSIDNILSRAKMDKISALSSINMVDCKYALGTYHPVTIGEGDIDKQMDEFLQAVGKRTDIEFILTKSNADQGGARINRILDDAEHSIQNIHVYTSLGVVRYLSLMKYSEFVIGNSSSGIIETPAFGIPTINIGDRQRGRLQSESIINCGEDAMSIGKAIDMALDDTFKNMCKKVVSPYGDGQSATKIANKIVEVVSGNTVNLKKTFYDLTM